MRTKSPSKTTLISLKKKLQSIGVDKLSLQVGFKKRRERKLTARLLILSFFSSCLRSNFSLNQWAISLGLMTGQKVSRQAIFERISASFIVLLKQLVQRSIDQKINTGKKHLLQRFSGLIIQDSSCISVPDSLAGQYPGNYSNGKIKAVAKMQLIINVLNGSTKSVELTPYSRNDQAASGDIVHHLRKGDLVIRDMGYFVIDIFRQIKERGADFISRLRADVTLLDSKTGKPINLSKLIKNKTFVKRTIVIGSKRQMEVTLMAIKVSGSVAHYRTIRASKDRDRRKKYTAERLFLMGWDIFISSVGDLTSQQIREIYRLRWQVELIFKSWKSHLRIEKNINPQVKRISMVEAIVYLSLLLAIMVIMPVYSMIINCRDLCNKISLLKLSSVLINAVNMRMEKMEFILYYAFYDTRKRINLAQKMAALT